jgi:hypothetical protein
MAVKQSKVKLSQVVLEVKSSTGKVPNSVEKAQQAVATIIMIYHILTA